jgi:hypothetical protein
MKLVRKFKENWSVLGILKGVGRKRVLGFDLTLTRLETQKNQFLICLH